MPRRLDHDELILRWTLLGDELERCRGKRGPSGLAFALVWKFCAQHGRFPRDTRELPDEAVGFVARQLGVDAAELVSFDWSGRTAERHRAELRELLGFRECTVPDQEAAVEWAVAEVTTAEQRPDQVRDELLGWLRRCGVEPPTTGRLERMVASARDRGERVLFERVAARLPVGVRERLNALVIGVPDEPDNEGVARGSGTAAVSGQMLAWVKTDPGRLSLNTMLDEIAKLETIRAIGLPDGLLADVAVRIVSAWRVRAAVQAPSHLRGLGARTRWVLLSALLAQRQREITDTLVELLISTVHAIGARAATEFRRNVQVKLRASYSHHYRAEMVKLLRTLGFRSSNTAHAPILDGIALVLRHAESKLQAFPAGDTVPLTGIVTGDWVELAYRGDPGSSRVLRTVYELCLFRALREQLRCKEIWVEGADRWRNPDHDLPQDFDDRREHYYRELGIPHEPGEFVEPLRDEMRHALKDLHDALPELPWLSIDPRGRGRITLSPLEPVPEPRNLRALKDELRSRWGMVPLLDMLTETALRVGLVEHFAPAGSRTGVDRRELAERLILCIFGYGTNLGLRAVAAGEHGHTEDELRYVRSRYLSADGARSLAAAIADATFAARRELVWGAGTGAVASDSTHFGAFDQNLFTQYHVRYGGRGVLIYWHVDTKSVAIHSQLISCTASEVAAMVEGAMHHRAELDVTANYVDSHGQSEIGFGLTRLLGFELKPRLKRINHTKLYLSAPEFRSRIPQLAPVLSGRGPIRWELISQQYDQLIRYATAISNRTAATEAILRRFTRAATPSRRSPPSSASHAPPSTATSARTTPRSPDLGALH